MSFSEKEKSPTNGSVEPFLRLLSLEAPPRFELGDQSFADSCLTTWLWRHIQFSKKNGADDEARTRYLHLGKVALYQMSYTRNNRCYYNTRWEKVKNKIEKSRKI